MRVRVRSRYRAIGVDNALRRQSVSSRVSPRADSSSDGFRQLIVLVRRAHCRIRTRLRGAAYRCKVNNSDEAVPFREMTISFEENLRDCTKKVLHHLDFHLPHTAQFRGSDPLIFPARPEATI